MRATESKTMQTLSSISNPTVESLVSSFSGELRKEEDYGGPEPDFQRWLEKTLPIDVAIAGDQAAYTELSAEEREAWQLYCNALEATGTLLDFFKSDPAIFQRLASQMMCLPCFLSRHPDNARFNRYLLAVSQLGMKGTANPGSVPRSQHLARQSWPVRYAYAIVSAIELTLDTYEDRLPKWADLYGYGVKHPIPMCRYEEAANKLGWDYERKRLELPHYVGAYTILPAWTKGLQSLRRPFNKNHVLDYWRTGKDMILEEMPDFHLKPEWESYRGRKYAGGAKKGAIQHAIFRDILVALQTIAGKNKRKRKTT